MDEKDEFPPLVNDKKYEGKYVALVFNPESTVVASGEDPAEVIKEARAAGFPAPVILFIPESGVDLMYSDLCHLVSAGG